MDNELLWISSIPVAVNVCVISIMFMCNLMQLCNYLMSIKMFDQVRTMISSLLVPLFVGN